MLAIKVYGHGVAIINVFTHNIIKILLKEDMNISTMLKIGENKVILAIQKEWRKFVENAQCRTGYQYLPFKDPTNVKLRCFLFDEKNLNLKSNGHITTSHVELTNNLLILKNKNIVSSCPCGDFFTPHEGTVQIWGIEND